MRGQIKLEENKRAIRVKPGLTNRKSNIT